MLTWTGPILLFLPPGMPSSLIAERKQTNFGKEHYCLVSKNRFLLTDSYEETLRALSQRCINLRDGMWRATLLLPQIIQQMRRSARN